MTVELHHATGDCTSHWRLYGEPHNRTLRCDGCGAEFVGTPERRLAAIDENYAGIFLRRLSNEGKAMLEGES